MRLRRGLRVATETAWPVLLAAADTSSEGAKCPATRVLIGNWERLPFQVQSPSVVWGRFHFAGRNTAQTELPLLPFARRGSGDRFSINPKYDNAV